MPCACMREADDGNMLANVDIPQHARMEFGSLVGRVI